MVPLLADQQTQPLKVAELTASGLKSGGRCGSILLRRGGYGSRRSAPCPTRSCSSGEISISTRNPGRQRVGSRPTADTGSPSTDIGCNGDRPPAIPGNWMLIRWTSRRICEWATT